jgi:hypothetical protein
MLWLRSELVLLLAREAETSPLPVRESAPFAAVAPSSNAGRSFEMPPKLQTGVRAALSTGILSAA